MDLTTSPANILQFELAQCLTTKPGRCQQEQNRLVSLTDSSGGINRIDHAPDVIPSQMIGDSGHTPAGYAWD